MPIEPGDDPVPSRWGLSDRRGVAPSLDAVATASRTAAIRVHTQQAGQLGAALAAAGHACLHLAADVVRVHDITADELGWLAARAAVVVDEMTAEEPDLEPLNPPTQR